MKSHNHIKIGYEISMEKGSMKPVRIQFWNDEKKFKGIKTSEPLKYMADAMVGLALIHLNQYIKSPLHTPHLNFSFAHDAWLQLDPHHELYKRSQERVLALQSKNRQTDPKIIGIFEKNLCQTLEAAQKPWGLDLTLLSPLLENIAQLEAEISSPLLFNFAIKFSKSFTEKLHMLYSFLFQLRSLIAVDHNAYITDSSHEAVKVDAITDYLPKSEYIANDAMLYLTFKQSSPADTHPLYRAFRKYSHNACHLIENLPPSFLNSMNNDELEEALYLVQMDWLLGSEAGLLFKIREELFGVQNGYENIFWNEVQPKAHAKPVTLSVCCEVTEKHIYRNQAA